ncbi:hypothetical protein [Streptomyces sp. NPDC088757]|uniref:hypothetical protein n=1 Tax=Streptomyces sp. NPDC088757 TaxID=3365889 RepID=UPI003821BB51
MGGLVMIASLALLLTIGTNKAGVIVAMILWGPAFGIVQLSQINMTLTITLTKDIGPPGKGGPGDGCRVPPPSRRSAPLSTS